MMEPRALIWNLLASVLILGPAFEILRAGTVDFLSTDVESETLLNCEFQKLDHTLSTSSFKYEPYSSLCLYASSSLKTTKNENSQSAK
jgi:hypothetical protein